MTDSRANDSGRDMPSQSTDGKADATASDIDVRDVVAWADGIQGALGSEHAFKVTEIEARIASAVMHVMND